MHDSGVKSTKLLTVEWFPILVYFGPVDARLRTHLQNPKGGHHFANTYKISESI